MGNFLVSKFSFKKLTGKNKNVKNFMIFNDNEKIRFTLYNVKTPFGYEKFNGGNILNIELMSSKNNDHYNVVATVLRIESELQDIKNIKSSEVTWNIRGKTFYSNIKENTNKDGHLLRTHIHSDPEIYMMIDGHKKKMTSSSIKQSTNNIELEASILWTNETNETKWGYTLTVKTIKIVHL